MFRTVDTNHKCPFPGTLVIADFTEMRPDWHFKLFRIIARTHVIPFRSDDSVSEELEGADGRDACQSSTRRLVP
jgi:hypothetical protein